MRAISMVMLSAVFAFSGCAAPTVDTSDESKMTFDGLYPVKGSRADEAWARPDVDLTQYSKIMLQSVGVEYRPGGESGRTFYSRSRGGPYEVTESGPDVLLIRGGLLDVVSYVPPDAVGGRVDVYLSQVGEATLVLELRDSITEAILARAVDRRAAEDFAGLQESNRVNNRAEVRRLAQTWARMLRERLDEFGAPAE